MTDRRALIDIVWSWDRLAVQKGKDAEMRHGVWRILDALYDDLAFYRTPGYRTKIKAALNALKQTEEVLAVRKELNL